MKNLIALILYIVPAFHLIAQPVIQWQRCLGGSGWDRAHAAIQCADGNYLVAAVTKSLDGDVSYLHGEHDFWLIKLDVNGSIIWEKTYGGTSAEFPSSILQLEDGGYIIAGSTNSNNGDVLGNHGDGDTWLVRVDSVGVLLWQRAIGGTMTDDIWKIIQTDDGGFVLAGASESNDGDVPENKGRNDFWVLKLNNLGLTQWGKTFGGSQEDVAEDVIQTDDGGYLVTGRTHSSDGDVSLFLGKIDGWVIKLDGNGEMVWERTLGGSEFDRFYGIDRAPDGSYMVCGDTYSTDGHVAYNHGTKDLWVVNIDKDGNIIWEKTYGGTSVEGASDIETTPDDGFILAGSTSSKDGDVTSMISSSNFWVIKIAATGDLLWQKTLGGNNGDQATTIIQTTDQGYLVCGSTNSNDVDVSGYHGGDLDAWVVKLSPVSSNLYSPSPRVGILDIVPNPANSTIHISIASEEPAFNLIISDLLGREISHQTVLNGSKTDVSALPNGLYIFTATTSDGDVFTGKFNKNN